MTITPKAYVVGSLATDSFVAVNKKVIRYFKGDATLAIILCELISIYKYQVANHRVDALDAFPLPIVFLERTLSLSAYKQQHALDRLQADNLLTTVVLGKPASRWVTLNFDAIAKLLDEVEQADTASAQEKDAFYKGIDEAVMTGEGIDDALDNMKEPLRGCVQIASSYSKLRGISVAWSGEAIGVLKLSVRGLAKNSELFDYGRFLDLLQQCSSSNTTLLDLLKEAAQKWKRIPERAPLNRLYDYRSCL